jgi:hypothetical protein
MKYWIQTGKFLFEKSTKEETIQIPMKTEKIIENKITAVFSSLKKKLKMCATNTMEIK